ncbi:hypothetical protein D3C86_1920500 [compost metagenome]
MMASAALSVSRFALPTPIIEAIHKNARFDMDQPDGVGTRAINPARDETGAIIVFPRPNTFPRLPVSTVARNVIPINQMNARPAMMASNTPYN